MLLLAFFTSADAQGGSCLKSGNSPFGFNLNSACYNAGTCENYDFDGAENMDNGQCNCADPFNQDSFVYMDLTWTLGGFSSGNCQEYTTYLYSILSYALHIAVYDAVAPLAGKVGELTCELGPDPYVGVTNGDTGYESTPPMLPLIAAILGKAEDYTTLYDNGYSNYPGKMINYYPYDAPGRPGLAGQQHCRICQEAPNNCVVYVNGVAEYFGPLIEDGQVGGHFMISFATDFNTYYDLDCAKADDYLPASEGEASHCTENTEKGITAFNVFNWAVAGNDGAKAHGELIQSLAQQPTTTPVGQPDYPATGFSWSNLISVEKIHMAFNTPKTTMTSILPLPSRSPTTAPSDPPTGMPTKNPTPEPTESPTNGDTCFTYGYTHQIEDLKFVGISQAGDRGCRYGLLPEWPGGNTVNMCDSPYVLCLPQENTPNVGFPTPNGGVELYLNSVDPYTLDQCKTECAYDQRCTGFEFYSETSDQLGLCILIDDIPIDIGTSAMSVIDTESFLLSIPDWSPASFGGGRICYAKEDYCNPYFQADDLSEAMLNCYCPNNRKGFYTKKVTRTVDATHFCGYDPDPTNSVTDRIKEAQANRMFHLCENWCLFNTQSPRTESWYHDPWNNPPCWREQYAGVGTHRSYCYRVIRDPYTIEQYFIDTRSANMCTTSADGDANPGNPTCPGSTYETNVIVTEEPSTITVSCDATSGSVPVQLQQQGTTHIVYLPAGVINLSITLTAGADLDLCLRDETYPTCLYQDTVCIAGHSCNIISSSGGTANYEGMNIYFSGDDTSAPVSETITVTGITTRDMWLDVISYADTTGTVTYSWDGIDGCDPGEPNSWTTLVCEPCASYTCDSGVPVCDGSTTVSCVDSISWTMAEEFDTCTDACNAAGMMCDDAASNKMTYAYSQSNTAEALQMFNGALGSEICTEIVQGFYGWAFPGVDKWGGCYARNDQNDPGTGNPDGAGIALDTPCNLSIGLYYQRLCGCYASA